MSRAGLPFAQTLASGTLLPKPLDQWVLERLAAYEVYPGRCQVRLDQARAVAEAQLNKALAGDAVTDAERDSKLDTAAAERWPTWQVVLVGLGGVVFGGGVMWLATAVTR